MRLSREIYIIALPIISLHCYVRLPFYFPIESLHVAHLRPRLPTSRRAFTYKLPDIPRDSFNVQVHYYDNILDAVTRFIKNLALTKCKSWTLTSIVSRACGCAATLCACAVTTCLSPTWSIGLCTEGSLPEIGDITSTVGGLRKAPQLAAANLPRCALNLAWVAPDAALLSILMQERGRILEAGFGAFWRPPTLSQAGSQRCWSKPL